MMLGVGIDIVEVDRITRIIGKYGSLFLNKVFSAQEIELCSGRARPAVHFAGRWAVKEAFYKALPRPCQGVSTWKSIQVLPDSDGRRPQILVCDESLSQELARAGAGTMHVSISHEQSYCTAIVMIERR